MPARSTPWEELQKRFELGEWQGTQEKRIAQQCFKAAWVTAAFHYGHRYGRVLSRLCGAAYAVVL